MTSDSQKTLKEVCELIVDCEHKTAPTQLTGYPSIRTPNIGRGRFKLEGVNRVSDETFKAWTRRAVPRENDLILAREAPVGNVAIIPESLKVCLGQRTVLIRPDKKYVVPQFLCYLLLGDEIQAKFGAYASGATVPHLNMRDIRGLQLPKLPSRSTQRKIAAVLSAYDDLIENNSRRIRILEEMAQAIYREWFVHFRFPGHEDVPLVETELGLVPAGWMVRKLGDVCVLIVGQSPKSEFYNEAGEGLPFHQGVKDFGPRFPTHRVCCTVDKRIAEAGDILFSVRAPVGRINITDRRIVIGRGLHAIRHKRGYQAFTFHQLKTKFFQEDMMGGGTIFKSVTKADMLGIELLLPPKTLLEEFEQVAEPISAQIANLTQRNKILRRTRDLLLPKLVSGQADVSGLDIADECPQQIGK